MTRRNRRPDRRRVKALRSYTIDEVARTLEIHRNTVRHWIKAGLPVIDGKRPILMLGADIAGDPATAVPGRTDVLPEMPQAAGAGGPDGGLRGEFRYLGRPYRHMPRLQSSDVPASVGRSIVRGRGRTRRPPDAGTATYRGYRHPQRELSPGA